MAGEDIKAGAQTARDRYAFVESWSRLNRQVDQIPIGWQWLYSELRFALGTLVSTIRSTIWIDGGWEEDGLLYVRSDTTDRVVQGVLRKARVRAMHTCMQCSKPGKLRDLDGWRQATLCGTCAGPRLLVQEVARLIGLDRCGSLDVGRELQSSPSAALVRAAAEAGALASKLPLTFVLEELDQVGQLRWLEALQDRLQDGQE